MRGTYLCLCGIAALLLAGCGGAPDISSPEDYVTALGTLDLDPAHYTGDRYYESLVMTMTGHLAQLERPEDLRTAFYRCLEVGRAQPEPSQDRLTWVNPYLESMNLIMYRLAEMRSAEAARVLVDLYCDPQAGWDAHAAERAADAVARCSELTLPLLKDKQAAGADVGWLVDRLEAGETRVF
jgi:hypothetical protein